jgi:hypothetical protein
MTSKSPEVQAEESLVESIKGLGLARGENVVHFLHLVLNKLFQLLVKPRQLLTGKKRWVVLFDWQYACLGVKMVCLR